MQFLEEGFGDERGGNRQSVGGSVDPSYCWLVHTVLLRDLKDEDSAD